jgi:hypothetical protein
MAQLFADLVSHVHAHLLPRGDHRIGEVLCRRFHLRQGCIRKAVRGGLIEQQTLPRQVGIAVEEQPQHKVSGLHGTKRTQKSLTIRSVPTIWRHHPWPSGGTNPHADTMIALRG